MRSYHEHIQSARMTECRYVKTVPDWALLSGAFAFFAAHFRHETDKTTKNAHKTTTLSIEFRNIVGAAASPARAHPIGAAMNWSIKCAHNSQVIMPNKNDYYTLRQCGGQSDAIPKRCWANLWLVIFARGVFGWRRHFSYAHSGCVRSVINKVGKANNKWECRMVLTPIYSGTVPPMRAKWSGLGRPSSGWVFSFSGRRPI